MKRDRQKYMQSYWEEHRKALKEKDKARRHKAIVERSGEAHIICQDNAYCLGCRECFKLRIRFLRMRANRATAMLKTQKTE